MQGGKTRRIFRMGIGQRIRQRRLQLGLTQTELGDLVGQSQRWVSSAEKDATLTYEQLVVLARALQRPLAWLLGEEAPPARGVREELADYLERLPLEVEVYEDLEAAAAMRSGAEPLDRIPIPARIRPSKRTLFAFRVRGASLEPDFHDGETIGIDPDRTPIPGNVVVALVDDELLLKRYVTRDERHFLVSAAGEREIELANIKGVGVWSTREL